MATTCASKVRKGKIWRETEHRARLPILLFSCWTLLFAAHASAQSDQCNESPREAVTDVRLPGQPFSAVPTTDGCFIFVSLTPSNPFERAEVAVLRRHGGAVALERIVSATDKLFGLALSPDGKILAAADNRGVTLFDVASLTRGDRNVVVASGSDGPGSGSVYVAFNPTGRVLAVADEQARAVTIYDYRSFSRGQPLKEIGKVSLDFGPTGLAFSPDGKLLYVTVQISAQAGTPCLDEGGRGQPHAAGQLVVVDAERASTDPANSIRSTVEAGCSPVRVALSPAGDRAYVTMRGSDALGVFDTLRMPTAPTHSAIGLYRVGRSPVGVVATDSLVFVANSDRFGDGQSPSVSVVDLRSPNRIRTIATRGFPRELSLTRDQKILLITDFTGKALQLVDLARF